MKSKHFLLALIASVTLMSFVNKKSLTNEKVRCKMIEKSVSKITDKFYAGKYEVTNGIYLQFLQSLQANGKTEQVKKALIDSLNWKDSLAYNIPYVDYYFRHPAYANYPLVNVSYEAATLFCEWLTNTYNSFPDRKYKKVIFRLPTLTEWQDAAKGGLKYSNYSWGDRQIENGYVMCNYRHIGDENLKYDSAQNKVIVSYSDYGTGILGTINDVADITAPVDSYFPNGYGLFNTCGNVAEMIDVKGIACGGGWRSVGGDVTITSKKNYAKSATDIGFRYFMEIVE